VIALSAGVLREEREKALAAGMSDFLPKPLEPQRVIRCLRRHIERHRGRPIPVVPRTSETEAVAPSSIGIEGLDERAISPSLRLDRPLVLSMLRRLLAEFGDIGGTQAEDLPGRLHKLRGSAQVVGATALARAAEDLEQCLKGVAAGDRQAMQQSLARRLDDLARAAEAPLRAEAERLASHRERQALEAGRQSSPLDPAALKELLELIEMQSTRAARRVEELSGPLTVSLGSQRLARLRTALEEFDFEAAAGALQA
jgi:CheY-like chemotaxis protein